MNKVQELSAKVSTKGQVVIPPAVRRLLGLDQGSVLRFVVEGESVRLLPAAGDVRRLKGRLAKPAQRVTVGDMNATVAERRDQVARRAR